MQTAKLHLSAGGDAPGNADRVPGLLYTDAVSFSVGCFCTFLACVVTAYQTDTQLSWMVCYALGTVTIFRILAVAIYGRFEVLSRIPDKAWAQLYSISGLVHVFLIGFWPLAIFAAPEDTASQLFSFGTAICFLVGLIARNFTSAILVRRQLLLGAIPMIIALIIPGEIWHAAFAIFFAIFCLTLLRISDKMRDTFSQAMDAAEENRRLAYSDTLTDLPNRAAMTRLIETAARADAPFALHFIDLDRFKRLNDSYGHAFGDRVLIEAAARIGGIAGENSTLSRFAGDEFVLLQMDVRERSQASDMAAAVISTMAQPMRIEGISLTIACSLGTALFPSDGRSLSEVIQRADTALYAAKAAGRGQHVFFDKAMEHREKERVRIEADLREAILSDQLHLVFQPIVDCATHKVASCEALLRWDHPLRGRLSPGIFLPIAEECGLMKAITDITLRKACQAARSWPDGIGVAINLSPSQLDRPDIVDTVLASARDAGLQPEQIEIEITENLFLDQDSRVLEKLQQLKAAGIRFSLDDFGTGYSNLGYISRLPLDKIKIDRTFVVQAMRDDSDRALLRGMIRLIHSLNLKIVVEGIENDDQLQMVMAEELVEELQGFIFGQPLPAEAIADLLNALDGSMAGAIPNSSGPVRAACHR
jgi:diguanylate cyclase (GGDEF)-like protein